MRKNDEKNLVGRLQRGFENVYIYNKNERVFLTVEGILWYDIQADFCGYGITMS